MAKGFGQSPNKAKQKAKSHLLQKFVFRYRSSDGYLNIVQIEETSAERAAQQFSVFISDLERCLSLLDKGGEL